MKESSKKNLDLMSNLLSIFGLGVIFGAASFNAYDLHLPPLLVLLIELFSLSFFVLFLLIMREKGD